MNHRTECTFKITFCTFKITEFTFKITEFTFKITEFTFKITFCTFKIIFNLFIANFIEKTTGVSIKLTIKLLQIFSKFLLFWGTPFLNFNYLFFSYF